MSTARPAGEQSQGPNLPQIFAILVAALLLAASASAQQATGCSALQYLENDANYISETKYVLPENCRKQLLHGLSSATNPTPDEQYLSIALSAPDRQASDVGAAYSQLCELRGYSRACSAVAMLVAFGDYGRESDLMRFLIPAADGDVPLAQVYLGRLHAARYEASGRKDDLCNAVEWWQRAAKLNDPAGLRFLRRLPVHAMESCTAR